MPDLDWTGIIAIEGEPTGDGRMLDPGAIEWDAGPWPLLFDRTDGDHTGPVVGSVTAIWRDGNLIRAEGVWSDSDDEEARADINRARELVDEGAVGVSVALDRETVEIRDQIDLGAEPVTVHWYSVIGDTGLPVASASRPWSAAAARNRIFEAATDTEGYVDSGAVARAFLWRDPDGDYSDKASYLLGFADIVNGSLRIVPRGVAAAVAALDNLSLGDGDRAAVMTRICALHAVMGADCPFADETHTLATISHDDRLWAVVEGRIRHLAIVDTPAFADARIGLVATAIMAAGETQDVFTDPAFGLSGTTDPRLARQEPERPGESVTWGAPLTVTEDGMVYGHAALWGRCHAGFRNRCVVPPKGGDYSRFLHGEAAPGVRTGVLTVGTTHARLQASAVEAMDHYSHTGRAAADVVIGEDAHGLWVSGRLRPGIDERDLADLRGSSLSGDWRPVNGKYRLCGLLAVNQPGYLVQRPALTASAAVITAGPCSCDSDLMADDDGLAAVVMALAERVTLVEEAVMEKVLT